LVRGVPQTPTRAPISENWIRRFGFGQSKSGPRSPEDEVKTTQANSTSIYRIQFKRHPWCQGDHPLISPAESRGFPKEPECGLEIFLVAMDPNFVV